MATKKTMQQLEYDRDRKRIWRASNPGKSSEYYSKHRDKIRGRYVEKREAILGRMRERYLLDPEKRREYARRRYSKKREKILEYERNRRADIKVENLAIEALWRLQNPEKVLELERQKRALELQKRRERYARNRDSNYQASRKWIAKNQEKVQRYKRQFKSNLATEKRMAEIAENQVYVEQLTKRNVP